MMRFFARRLRFARRHSGEDGVALAAVIGLGAVMLLLAALALTTATSGMRSASTDQSWSAAGAAAYAGVDEYESRLQADATYVKYGNPASNFSPAATGTPPVGGVVLPPVANPAFGVGVGGSWASVPGATNGAQFRYEVDNSQYAAKGTLRLRVTGKVGNSTRSIVANLKQQGFIDFLYFTQYEIMDPAQSSSKCTPSYAWASKSGHDSDCTEIQFADNDIINGPLHSNDTLRVCGSTFNGKVTTSNDTPPYYVKVSGCSSPTFNKSLNPANQPINAPTIDMPATNSSMIKETRSDLSSDVPRPGCLYTGPTSIVMAGTGKMTVISPFTKVTNTAGDPASSGSTPSQCGTPGTGTGQLGSVGGATIPVLDNNLIYVQDVPTRSGDPNYWAANSNPTYFTCANATNGGFTLKSGSTVGMQYPVSGEDVPSASPAHYSCRKGDAYVQGTLKGAMTIAAMNYVYVTGDILYSNKTDSSTDILGLVGSNAVWVWNPMVTTTSCGGWFGCSSSTGPSLPKNREIDAAILSVAHTFQVQNFDVGGDRGTLTVLGAIAQKFRGTVGQGSNGYAKNYNYDTRLRNIAPPKFLAPTSTTYGVTQYAGVATAFNADGSAR